jgi:xanthine dehydrogenase YagT iron-sulfur-binding subunit
MKEDRDDDQCECRHGITRRSFLTLIGAGTMAAAVSGGITAASGKEPEVMKPEEPIKVVMMINGQRHRVFVEPRWSLLYVLREKIGLTGTKIGCERGECGACTVLIDGVPRYACMTLTVEVSGSNITTVEGLMSGEDLGPVQQAFVEDDALQCGYCTPGQIMAIEGLLRKNPDPSLEDIQKGVSGNLCRCGAYVNIFKAGRRAAQLRQKGRGAP